jgi:hypothetical protein
MTALGRLRPSVAQRHRDGVDSEKHTICVASAARGPGWMLIYGRGYRKGAMQGSGWPASSRAFTSNQMRASACAWDREPVSIAEVICSA